MSVLDGLTESRTDVSRILREEERLIICPVDKRPADYLMLENLERITLIMNVNKYHYSPKSPGSYSWSVFQKVLDYLYSVPNIRNLSTAVMLRSNVTISVDPNSYESMLNYGSSNYSGNHWSLTVSFLVEVYSFYSLMKLIRGLYMCAFRFKYISRPIIRWKTQREEFCYMKFDNEFINKLGLKDNYQTSTMIPGYILTMMCELSRQVGLLDKNSSDEDADKVKLTDEIEKCSIRLKNRNKLKMNAV